MWWKKGRKKKETTHPREKRANKVVESTSEIYGWNDNILIIFRMKIAWIEQNGHTLIHLEERKFVGPRYLYTQTHTHIKCAFTIFVCRACIHLRECWECIFCWSSVMKRCVRHRSTWAKTSQLQITLGKHTHIRFVTYPLSILIYKHTNEQTEQKRALSNSNINKNELLAFVVYIQLVCIAYKFYAQEWFNS